jgi:hypothetical protein
VTKRRIGCASGSASRSAAPRSIDPDTKKRP